MMCPKSISHVSLLGGPLYFCDEVYVSLSPPEHSLRKYLLVLSSQSFEWPLNEYHLFLLQKIIYVDSKILVPCLLTDTAASPLLDIKISSSYPSERNSSQVFPLDPSIYFPCLWCRDLIGFDL